MKSKFLFFSTLALVALFAAGCSTTASRIRQNPELFAQLDPAQQEMIRRGQVAVGFSAEAVRLALGEPDRFTMRTDADSTNEVWHYVTYDTPAGVPLYRGWYHRYYMWGDPLYPYYLSDPNRRERERFSVLFANGRVLALEREVGR
jgi:outer membrane protein assembly factor BamE (lipoprotein component of BamABCDE complex)